MKKFSNIYLILGIAFSFLLSIYSVKFTSILMFKKYNGIQLNELYYITEFSSLIATFHNLSLMLLILCISMYIIRVYKMNKK